MRTRRSRSLALAAFLGATLASGAALADKPKSAGEKIGERISRGVVEESLETLDKPENRERLGRIMNSPQMRTAMHDITESIVLGVVHGIRKAKVEKLMGLDAKSIGVGMDEHVTPAAGRLTYRIVDSAVSASLQDKHIGQIEKLAEGTTHAVLAGVGTGIRDEVAPSLAVALDKDIGPAIAQMIERDIMPAVGRGLDSPEMQSAIANTVRNVASELVAGTDDAMEAEKAKDEQAGKESGLQVFGGRIAIGYAVAVFVAFALGTALVVLTVLMVRNVRRTRHQHEEAKRREETLMHLLDSIEADHPELRTDMHRLVREQLNTEQT
ncbi:MAG TPA: hypothetical protein VG755_20940 [Nannocystaceae bacterium]|nr:hypothetical protein [Nannocystaceae bacterium]